MEWPNPERKQRKKTIKQRLMAWDVRVPGFIPPDILEVFVESPFITL
jgi:hypothetical protein